MSLGETQNAENVSRIQHARNVEEAWALILDTVTDHEVMNPKLRRALITVDKHVIRHLPV